MTSPEPPGETSRDHWVLDALGRFERPLTLYAQRLLGDSERARDVVQDTFLRLCGQSRTDLDGRLAEWLFTVCRNRSLDVLRKEGRMTRLGDDQVQTQPSSEPDPALAVEQSDTAQRALQMLEGLPPNQREVPASNSRTASHTGKSAGSAA
jgi:RNA polymerase sigma-70 factor (ECF subfamily)